MLDQQNILKYQNKLELHLSDFLLDRQRLPNVSSREVSNFTQAIRKIYNKYRAILQSYNFNKFHFYKTTWNLRHKEMQLLAYYLDEAEESKEDAELLKYIRFIVVNTKWGYLSTSNANVNRLIHELSVLIKKVDKQAVSVHDSVKTKFIITSRANRELVNKNRRLEDTLKAFSEIKDLLNEQGMEEDLAVSYQSEIRQLRDTVKSLTELCSGLTDQIKELKQEVDVVKLSTSPGRVMSNGSATLH